jgi:predicted MPP superfamily phosphohydrolase
MVSRRQFIAGILAAPALAGLYAWRVEPTWAEFVRRDLPIRNLPAGLAGRSLVHLSDIHIGPQVDDDYLIDVFARVRALSPDLVVHTGDLVTYRGAETIEQARKVVSTFPRGQLGTFAILGNHDYGEAWSEPAVAQEISRLLSDAGCLVLRNQAAEVAGLTVIGLDDTWAGRFAPRVALRSLRADQPVIALSHNPDTCDQPGWDGFQGWILAGHTHGGQCKPPFLPPPMLPVKNRRYAAGAYDLTGGRQLYINRGLGHLLRARFDVRPEVTVFRLIPA